MKKTISAFKKTPAQLAIIGCFALAAPAAAVASPLLYHDTYTLQTTNQSMWASGVQSSWSYDSGFQGAKWGTYAGNSPASGGINAISGSPNTEIFPATPGTPSVHIPSTRTCWAGICTPELGNYDIPGIPSTPAVTADTRTGAAISASSSGQVGVEIKAKADGGAIAVVLPVSSQLAITETNPGKFHVSGSSIIISGAAISSTAPSFKAGVDGIINLDNSISATGCFIGVGCSTSGSSLNVDPGKFSIVAVDTTATKPFSAFGQDIPQVQFGKQILIRSGTESQECKAAKASPGLSALIENGTVPDPCAAGPFAAPVVATIQVDKLLDHTGGTLSSGTLTARNQQSVLTVTADLTGILQKALGFPVDVLNPELNLKVATVSGSLIDVQAGIALGLKQTFAFTPDVLTRLTFDRDVLQYERRIVSYNVSEAPDFGCSLYQALGNAFSAPSYECNGINRVTRAPVYGLVAINVGHQITLDLFAGADFSFVSGMGNLLGRDYFVKDASNFRSQSNLTIDPTLPIKAGCFDLELAAGLGGTGLQCAFTETYKTTGLADIEVYQNSFSLIGFNIVSLASDDPLSVPEPSSILLMLLGLFGLDRVLRARRKAKADPVI